MKILLAVPLIALSGAFTSTPRCTRTFKLLSSPKDSFDADRLRQSFNVDKIKQSIPDFSRLLENSDAIRDNILSGDFGARGETYVIAQFVLLLFIVTGNVPFIGGLLTFLLGPILMFGGAAVALIGATELGASLSPWPVASEQTQLNTSGVYGLVRHPIYAGLLAACAGLSVVTGSVFRLLLTIALYYVLDFKSDYEERDLMEIFPEYQFYREEVPKFFPRQILDSRPYDRRY